MAFINDIIAKHSDWAALIATAILVGVARYISLTRFNTSVSMRVMACIAPTGLACSWTQSSLDN